MQALGICIILVLCQCFDLPKNNLNYLAQNYLILCLFLLCFVLDVDNLHTYTTRSTQARKNTTMNAIEQAYAEGVENGKLCKMHSEPNETISDDDFRNVAPFCTDDSEETEALLDAYVAGCRAGFNSESQIDEK